MGYVLTEVGCEESFTKDEQQVTRTFHVNPWSSRREFLVEVMGGVEVIGNQLFRVFPKRDPEYPWLWAKSCKFGLLTDDPGTAAQSANFLVTRSQYQTAVATVVYSPLDHDQGSSDKPKQNEQQEMDLASVGWDFSARNLTLPNQWMVWEGDVEGSGADGAVANSNMAAVKIYPGLQVVATRHLVARKPHNAILGQLGKLNGGAFTLAGDTYPKETLRFDSAKATKKWTTKGQKYYEITYTFACQPQYEAIKIDGTKGYVGWNRAYDPRKGYWRKIRTNNAGVPKYLYEIDTTGPSQSLNGQSKSGYNLLFHPAAS